MSEVDRLTKEQRHKNMKNIKSKDTSIELKLRKELWKRGYRYRKNYAGLPGKPDIVLTKYKIVIYTFVQSYLFKILKNIDLTKYFYIEKFIKELENAYANR